MPVYVLLHDMSKIVNVKRILLLNFTPSVTYKNTRYLLHR